MTTTCPVRRGAPRPGPATLDHPGPFTSLMARDLGLTRRDLADLVERRLVARLLEDVYVDATVPVDLDLRVAAIALVAPPEAVVVDRTAAWLHGLDLLRRSSVHEAPPVDMYLTKDSRMRRDGVASGRRGVLARDVTEVGGIPVTTPVRTALDLARSMWRYDALGALDQFLRHGVASEELAGELGRFRGYRGVRQARLLLPLADARAESMPESALRLHWHDAGLPWPHPQLWVGDRFRLDVADPRRKYFAEYDGEDHHTAADDMAYDAERRGWLSDEGWEFDVFTKHSVYGNRPRPADVLQAGWDRARGR